VLQDELNGESENRPLPSGCGVRDSNNAAYLNHLRMNMVFEVESNYNLTGVYICLSISIFYLLVYANSKKKEKRNPYLILPVIAYSLLPSAILLLFSTFGATKIIIKGNTIWAENRLGIPTSTPLELSILRSVYVFKTRGRDGVSFHIALQDRNNNVTRVGTALSEHDLEPTRDQIIQFLKSKGITVDSKALVDP
jgi:hypothetical protein